MSQHTFETHGPIKLYVDLERGDVRLWAADTTESTVTCTGHGADEVAVSQDGEVISVIGPRSRSGFLRNPPSIAVEVRVPTGSDVQIKTGSADVDASGTFGTGRVKTGSGDLQLEEFLGAAELQTGSGDIELTRAGGETRVQSGSGDIRVDDARDELIVSTGSGDVLVGHALGAATLKTGSGDLRVRRAETDVTLSAGTGDLVIEHAARGVLNLKGASSDVVVGVPAGLPVYSDVSTVTGSVHSEIQGVGAPEEGQDHLEVHAKTVSGDVTLRAV